MFYFIALLSGFLLLACFVYYQKIIKVPEHLKHLPGPTVYASFRNFYDKRTISDLLPEYYTKYGKVFRMFSIRGRWVVVVCDPDTVKAVIKDPKTFGKITNRTPLLYQNVGQGIVASQGAQWKKQRKICNPAFSFQYLKSFTPIFSNSANLAINHAIHNHNLNSTNEKIDIEFDVSNWMQLMTLDVLGKSIFGMDFACLSTEQQTNKYTETYNKVMGGLFDPIRFLTGGISDNLPIKRATEFKQYLQAFNDILYGVIEARRNERKNNTKTDRNPDLLDMMLNSMDSDDGELELTTQELHNNMFVFFIAGHDTTSSALTMALHFLSRNPDVQEKARQEIQQVLNGKTTIEYDDQKQFKYLTQVIKETMRMHSPVLQIIRETTTNATITLPDTKNVLQLQKGDSVAIGIHAIHRSNDVWGEESNSFNPNKFDSDKRNHPFAWMPFGAGQRSCIGSNFSLIEQRIFLATVLQQYDLLPAQPHHQQINIKSPPLLSVDNVFVRFVERA